MGSVVLALVGNTRNLEPRASQENFKEVKMLEMNIETLLQAAEYIERREREAEHGYASTLPTTSEDQIIVSTKNQRLKTSSTKKATGSRSTHNELEKNRRAHLRSCLENLKDLVPVGADSSRHTTLGLLNKAKHFIKNLEERDKKSLSAKELLHREQRYLRRRLELLSEEVGVDIHKRRSISDSSSSLSSVQSSNSESDEVDQLSYSGYGTVSDDDRLSIMSGGSLASDGGVTITTWRHLSLAEKQ